MSYAAAASLLNVICKFPMKVSRPYSESQYESLFDHADFITSLFEEDDEKEHGSLHGLEKQAIGALYEAEDIIESHIITSLSLSSSSSHADQNSSISDKLEQVLQKLDYIKETVQSRIEDHENDVDHGREEAEDEEPPEPFVLSRFLEGKNKFVGHEDELMKIKDQLDYQSASSGLKVVAVFGMIGIGKTALVDEIYNDPLVASTFGYRDWISVGHGNGMREILLGLVKPDPESSTTTDEELAICLGKLLSGRRYLIVLDDMRDEEVWLSLKSIFPEDKNGSRIIVTARQLFVQENELFYDYSNIVRFLNEDESWELLCCAAIGEEEMCPTQLVKIGRIISHDCEGLPLKVITLGSLLSRLPQDPEAWSELADDRKKQNMEMLKVTQDLRNEFMPQIVKTCFLYILAFPQYQRIAPPQLFKLWTAEGFILIGDHPAGEVESTFFDLIQRNLVMVHAWSSMNAIKTCSIHSAIWPFYHREAMDNKVFQSIKSWKDEACPSHRRFSIHKNVLLAIKDVYDSIASVSNARSLLCSGPYHPYPLLRVDFKSFRLLKVLDALSIRFYIFPFEIVKLVLLRFVALTLCKGELPTSVSNLEQLEFLIVRLHSSIKSSGTPCFLPMEIWNMKELMHLQVMGSDLPSPPPYDDNVRLPNLITLLDVSPLSCTKEVFERVPNLKKLGVVAELPWDEARAAAAEAPPLHVFNHLVHLEHLESFKYYLRNPILSPVPPYSHFVFPRRLHMLTLSGCALSWENMKEVARLPNLIVLKLRCHAFRGPKWEMDDQDKFERLRVLVLEDLDLEQWTAEDYNFPVLHRLVVSHCYKLKNIPSQIINGEMIEQIELVDCSPSVVDSAAVEQQERGNERLQVTIYSSWT